MDLYEVRELSEDPSFGATPVTSVLTRVSDEESAIETALGLINSNLFVYLVSYISSDDSKQITTKETLIWDDLNGFADGRDKPDLEELERLEYLRLKEKFEGSPVEPDPEPEPEA